MSYEGYVQTLCENGHYAVWDCYDDPFGGYIPNEAEEQKPVCGICGAYLVWRNDVDETNGCDATEDGMRCGMGLPPEKIRECRAYGCGYVALKEKTPAETCTCDKCGHVHTKPPTYFIPEEGRVWTRETN